MLLIQPESEYLLASCSSFVPRLHVHNDALVFSVVIQRRKIGPENRIRYINHTICRTGQPCHGKLNIWQVMETFMRKAPPDLAMQGLFQAVDFYFLRLAHPM